MNPGVHNYDTSVLSMNVTSGWIGNYDSFAYLGGIWLIALVLPSLPWHGGFWLKTVEWDDWLTDPWGRDCGFYSRQLVGGIYARFIHVWGPNQLILMGWLAKTTFPPARGGSTICPIQSRFRAKTRHFDGQIRTNLTRPRISMANRILLASPFIQSLKIQFNLESDLFLAIFFLQFSPSPPLEIFSVLESPEKPK